MEIMWKVVLLGLLFAIGTISSSPPCADVTHSYCGDDDLHMFLETTTTNKEACQTICLALIEKCHFSLFDNIAFDRGNCRLYDEDFSKYIHHCNELAGPKISGDGCDFLNPPDNSCQVYRSGQCDFEDDVHETLRLNSTENCQAACNSITECNFWRFEREEKLCKILYSSERSCAWEFSPREPSFKDCGDESCGTPDPLQHGEWFCPSSSSTNTATCHLECHPGYVSDERTVITCSDGIWSSSPVCVEAIGLITGNDIGSGGVWRGTTVEVYGENKHQFLPDLPEDRSFHTLDITDGYILLCGDFYVLETSCLELAPSLDWRIHSTTTSKRFGHSSVSILGQLHLLGGNDGSLSTEHLSPATSTTWIPGHDLLEDTFGACAAKIHPEIFIVTGGGYNPANVISYNISSSISTRLQNMKRGRYLHGCLYIRQSPSFRGILVAGGLDDYSETILSHGELYDLSTGQWTNTGTLTRPRAAFPLLQLGEEILALGGGDDYDDETSSATVDRFNTSSISWYAGEPMLEARALHAATGVPHNRVF